MNLTEDHVLEALKKVIDPELFVNIVDLGLIYEVSISPAAESADKAETEGDGDNDLDDRYQVHIEMTMTSPMCPAGPQLVSESKQNVAAIECVDDVEVKVVMDPPWTQDRMTDDARDQLGIF